jgi:two-component system chemotaxis response regulator CheY
MRVLIVDDSKTMRSILRGLMQSVSFDVVEASSGKDGLAKLEAGEPFDLALIDWNMPEMSGLDLVRALRKDTRFASVRLMMVTTESEYSQIVRALAAGAHEYLIKPFTADAVEEKLAILGMVPDHQLSV